MLTDHQAEGTGAGLVKSSRGWPGGMLCGPKARFPARPTRPDAVGAARIAKVSFRPTSASDLGPVRVVPRADSTSRAKALAAGAIRW